MPKPQKAPEGAFCFNGARRKAAWRSGSDDYAAFFILRIKGAGVIKYWAVRLGPIA